MKFARASIMVLVIQLGVVCSIAGKYLLERATSPRVWTRALAYDPEMIMRGRYLSMQLTVDACGISVPIAQGQGPDGDGNRLYFHTADPGMMSEQLPVIVSAKDGKLVALRIEHSTGNHRAQDISMRKNSTCHDTFLQQPIDYYISESAKSPFPLKSGQTLWVEVTVPQVGPPRPINLAINDGVHWQPLNYR